jgi:hypothetical protein
MTGSRLLLRIGRQITLPGHCDVPLLLEDVGVLGETTPRAMKLLINPPWPPFVKGGMPQKPPLKKGAARSAGGFAPCSGSGMEFFNNLYGCRVRPVPVRRVGQREKERKTFPRIPRL